MSSSASQASDTAVFRVWRRVIAVVRVPGFHCWPDAPNEVRYLADRHRHLFTVRVEWPVTHAERQVEFFTAQEAVKHALHTRWPLGECGGHEFGASSCEAIALGLCQQLTNAGSEMPNAIEVWEDDEDGARIELERERDAYMEHAESGIAAS